jgi:hypothetical protein|tara:strand:- start:176 stop:433 length:258 start_codon:yes stop_codon:yes gene_type:complete
MRKWRTTNQLIPKATWIFLGVLSPLLGFADKSTEEKKAGLFSSLRTSLSRKLKPLTKSLMKSILLLFRNWNQRVSLFPLKLQNKH